jgi:SAM-dependent methyltransferase
MEWFENEDFWRELYPYMFPPERLEAATMEVDQVLRLAQVTNGAVLDLCCGPGRHAVEFAQRGFHVTGVDASAYLLARADERAGRFKVQVEWVQDDMRRFRRHLRFDLVCILFTSFGYFDTDDENLQVARNVLDSLKPGGVLVIDVIGKERLARNWQNSLISEFTDGTLLVQLPQVSRAWTRVSTKWLLIKERTVRTFQFEHTIYSARELEALILRAGFEKVEIFGSLQGAPYGLDAERLVAVARKVGSQ